MSLLVLSDEEAPLPPLWLSGLKIWLTLQSHVCMSEVTPLVSTYCVLTLPQQSY